MTKKNKMCYRTVDPHNEPIQCIGNKCMAWIDTKTMSGCAFVLNATTEAIKNLYEAKKLQGERDDRRKMCEQCEKNQTTEQTSGDANRPEPGTKTKDGATQETQEGTNDS